MGRGVSAKTFVFWEPKEHFWTNLSWSSFTIIVKFVKECYAHLWISSWFGSYVYKEKNVLASLSILPYVYFIFTSLETAFEH